MLLCCRKRKSGSEQTGRRFNQQQQPVVRLSTVRSGIVDGEEDQEKRPPTLHSARLLPDPAASLSSLFHRRALLFEVCSVAATKLQQRQEVIRCVEEKEEFDGERTILRGNFDLRCQPTQTHLCAITILSSAPLKYFCAIDLG